MTYWGYVLLVSFVVLGLTERMTWRRAGKAAVILTAILVVAAFAKLSALR